LPSRDCILILNGINPAVAFPFFSSLLDSRSLLFFYQLVKVRLGYLALCLFRLSVDKVNGVVIEEFYPKNGHF